MSNLLNTPPDMSTPHHRPDGTVPPTKLVSYADYRDAQAAVDRLSDAGFPVSAVSIVWAGLRRIEYVTGRRTVLTAALEGALSGAWFGSLIGLLFAVFATDASTSTIGVVVSFLAVGAVAGAIWHATAHAVQRGRRDFASLSRLDADSYELWVDPAHYGAAAELLQISTIRPEDPGPVS